MKRIICIISFALLFVNLTGCGGPRTLNPGFNQTYMPETTPGKPLVAIDLPDSVKYKEEFVVFHTKGRGLLSSGVPTNAWVHASGKKFPEAGSGEALIKWVADDNIYFEYYDKDREKMESYIIVPSTREIIHLEGAEKEALFGELRKKISVENVDTHEKTLLVNAAKERGFRIGDAQVAEALSHVPYFQVEGKFSKEKYL